MMGSVRLSQPPVTAVTVELGGEAYLARPFSALKVSVR